VTARTLSSFVRNAARHLAREVGALSITLALFMFVGLSGTAACAWFTSEAKTTGTQISACAATEEQAAAKGIDVLQVAEEIAAEVAAIAASGGVVAALEATILPLIEKYGEPVVSCVVKDKLGIGQGSGSASAGSAGTGSAPAIRADPSPEHLLLVELAARRGWDK
jgi:hypothetical protein